MPIQWNAEEGNLFTVVVFNKLGKHEHDQIQAEIETAMKDIGQITILVILKDFTGWEKAPGWEDTSVQDRTDQFIKKMAIVGDAKWRDLVTVFTLKGLRPVPIEYFEEDQESMAREWLSSD